MASVWEVRPQSPIHPNSRLLRKINHIHGTSITSELKERIDIENQQIKDKLKTTAILSRKNVANELHRRIVLFDNHNNKRIDRWVKKTEGISPLNVDYLQKELDREKNTLEHNTVKTRHKHIYNKIRHMDGKQEINVCSMNKTSKSDVKTQLALHWKSLDVDLNTVEKEKKQLNKLIRKELKAIEDNFMPKITGS